MLPTDFGSFALGFDLTAANYSGGAGGTFTNLKPGGEAWTVDGATPTFSTESTMEGMDFNGNSNESVLGQMRALYEATVLVITRPDSGASLYPFGHNDATANGYAIFLNGSRARTFSGLNSSDWATHPSGQPNVIVGSWSPFNETMYVQVNDNAVVSTSVPYQQAALEGPNGAIGRMRTTHYSGWTSRVLVFNRALHYRDNANLQLLIAAEMAKIAL